MEIKKLCLIIFCCIAAMQVHSQFAISSAAFPPGGNIPEKYTAFKGLNVNPPLGWVNKPVGTQSFLLVLFDRTFCAGRADTVCRSHWIVKDIAATVSNIQEGTSSTGPLPAGALLGKSDNAIHGIREYIGPFPDSTTIHLYEFKLYALNVASLNCVTPYYNLCLQKAMAGKVLGTASLSGYYLPRQFAPLPVHFVSVDAVCNITTINCKWVTAIESANANNFEVQRSVDGNNFYPIGTIPCTGNTSTLHEYNFTDSSNTKKAYYRIKQTDRDGVYMYSSVAFVKCGGVAKESITVLPNPSPDKFTVNFDFSRQHLRLTVFFLDRHGVILLPTFAAKVRWV